MRVKSVRLQNFRSYKETDDIFFSQINVLIGANNSGKSAIIKSLMLLQTGYDNAKFNVRAGEVSCEVEIELEDFNKFKNWYGSNESQRLKITAQINASGNINYLYNGGHPSPALGPISDKDSNHFILPHFSKRKSNGFSIDVGEGSAGKIIPNYSNLSSKISTLSNPTRIGTNFFWRECENILGFKLGNIPSGSGSKPGIYVGNNFPISVEQLGEGVPNIVSLLADMAESEGKLFLIEEPENDLHPEALKSLLNLIIESSRLNQFVISTHSNIVLRHLGAEENAKIYKITAIIYMTKQSTSTNLFFDRPTL
jgi:predicted ATPase